MSEIKVDIKFTQTPVRAVKGWTETKKRAEHIFDRMRARGIGVEQIKEAIQRGAKILRKDGSIIAEYRYFKVAYREFRIGETRNNYIYNINIINLEDSRLYLKTKK